MKNLLIVIILMMLSLQGWSQGVSYSPDQVRHGDSQDVIAYVSLAPEELGIGMRLDIHGVYTSMTYGNYQLPYGGYIKDHARVSIGGIYKWFSLGMSYHHYGEVLTDQQLTNMALKPVSVEAGARIFINRFAACIRYDVLKHEGILDFGWTF